MDESCIHHSSWLCNVKQEHTQASQGRDFNHC